MSDPSSVHRPAVATGVLISLAMLCTTFAGGRQAIELCAWLAPVPWLLWVRRVESWRGRGLVLLAALLAGVAQLATIVTPPIPWFMPLAFGLPAGLGLWLMLMIWDALRRRTSEGLAILAFASLNAVSDWTGAMSSPMGTWATSSAGVPNDLVLLQLASVLGVAGVGFVMGWVPAWLAAVLAHPERRWHGHTLAVTVALAAVFGFGTWRLAQPSAATTTTVAAVTTSLGFGEGGLPDHQALAAEVDALFERSERAVDRGARLVVWNEGATAVSPDEERALLDRGRAFAREHHVDLVLAYIVVTREQPLAFDNLAVFIDDAGEVLTRYYKRHPVPGETEPSSNPVPRLERPYGVVSLAICYDADFPEMARAHADVGAAFVALPSSDWAGIDPIHTLMSRVRAIEGGYAMLRSTRWAASAGFDSLGRVRGWMRADEDAHVLLVDLPMARRPTLYARIGDRPIALAGAYLLGLVGLALRRRGRL